MLTDFLLAVFDGNGDGNGNPVASGNGNRVSMFLFYPGEASVLIFFFFRSSAVATGNSADQNKLGGLVDSISKGLSGRGVLDGGVLSGNTNAAGTNNGNDNNLKDVLSRLFFYRLLSFDSTDQSSSLAVFSNNGNSNGNPSASNNGNRMFLLW